MTIQASPLGLDQLEQMGMNHLVHALQENDYL